jgi:hypothetical protein
VRPRSRSSSSGRSEIAGGEATYRSLFDACRARRPRRSSSATIGRTRGSDMLSADAISGVEADGCCRTQR